MFWSMCISNQRVWEHNHPLFFQAVALIYLRYRCFEKAGITRCLRVISQHGEGVLRWADIPFYDIGLGVGQTSKGCNMLGRWCIQLSGTSNARATVNLYSHKSRSSGCRRRKTLSPPTVWHLGSIFDVVYNREHREDLFPLKPDRQGACR